MSEKTIIDKREAVKETFKIPQSDVAPTINEDFKAASSSSDIHKLFEKFNKLFFWGKLNGVKLEWSNKMTRCAGKCYSRPRQKYYCVRLSRPLLTQRPHSDLVETLLHEMIHAYLSVTGTRDYDSHGPKFHEHMDRINKAVGTNISVYHTFHKEVKALKQHWWRCDGPCRNRGPYYGWTKRAVNRAPGPWDFWWRTHGNRCGGRFVKVKEPIEFTRKRVYGLVGYGGITSNITRLSLNNFGFEFMYTGETLVEFKGRFASPHMGVSRGETTRSSMVDCPVCNRRICKGFLNEHLKVCEDLKTIFEEDGFSGKCFGKNDLDTSTCPLCSSLFRGTIKEHLKKCDGLQGVFDGENSSTTDEVECVRATREESRAESCLVCEELLGGISLKDHLESCEGLQGIFDDEVIFLDDDCDGKESTNCKNVQQCPICNKDVANLSDHLSTCLNFNDELTRGLPNTTDTATDDITASPNIVMVTIENKALDKSSDESHVNTLMKCGSSISSGNICIGLNSSYKYPNSRRKETNQNILKANCEPLIFCRSCRKFYSVSHCPVCVE